MAYLTGLAAKERYIKYLSDFELKEIGTHGEVYYVGQGAKKNHDLKGPNDGFDESDGTYKIVPNDHIHYRFEILRILGKGSSGSVLKCYDHKYAEYVAVKVVTNTDTYRDNAFQEIDMLSKLNRLDKNNTLHIVQLREHFFFRNHICIVMELLSLNLYELTERNQFKGFSIRLIRKFTQAILECLEAMHKKNIIHCDMKPENILLKEKGKSAIKIIDFGSACYENQTMYQYIQSRAYRAPEVIMGAPYGKPIDMWSLGCIVAELFTGYPLFPGDDEDDQIGCMMEVLGMPPSSVLKPADRKYNFISSKGFPRYCTITLPEGDVRWTDGRNKYGKIRGYPGSKDLATALKGCHDKLFLDFIKKCIDWDPAKRMTASQALKHEFITQKVTHKNKPQKSSSKAGLNQVAQSTPSKGQPKSKSFNHY